MPCSAEGPDPSRLSSRRRLLGRYQQRAMGTTPSFSSSFSCGLYLAQPSSASYRLQTRVPATRVAGTPTAQVVQTGERRSEGLTKE